MTLRALPIALALAASTGFGTAIAAESGLMDAWKAYAQSSITPEFSWAEPQRAAAPTLRSRRVAQDPSALQSMSFALGNGLFLRLGEQPDSSSGPATSYSQVHGREFGFAQNRYASTLSALLPGDVGLSLGAVVAQQRFLTPGMGESFWRADGRAVGVSFGPAGEVVSGFGLRADLRLPMNNSSRWIVSAQSRIDMDSFKSYRGVYSEAGDFDTPAQVGLRFAQDIGRATLSIGADRIFYSDISAVTSYSLPNRLLSLLGDGNSPEFAWLDHTVYSAGLDYAISQRGGFTFRYSTRLQPSPSSAQLLRAMQADFSDRNFALGYRHSVGRLGSLLFSASYSGASYFVGGSPLRQSDFDRGSISEFEVLWALPF